MLLFDAPGYGLIKVLTTRVGGPACRSLLALPFAMVIAPFATLLIGRTFLLTQAHKWAVKAG